MQLLIAVDDPVSLTVHDAVQREHFDEAAFLYEQRRRMAAEADQQWTRVEGTEQRLEAHLDALIVGRQRVLELCRVRAAEGDPSELFVAVCVMCRHLDSAGLGALLTSVGEDDMERLSAVRDALRVEMPRQWASFVEGALVHRDAAWVGLLADVCAHRQLPLTQALLSALDRGSATSSVVRALGELRLHDAADPLWRCLESPDASVRSAALVALCRLGEAEALAQSLDVARKLAWPRRALGLGGDRLAVDVLIKVVLGDSCDSYAVEALGLLGDPAATSALLSLLSREDLSRHAAHALHWITGAALFEETFVPDTVDEATMSEEELLAWRTHQQLPVRSDGEPFGEVVRTLSINPLDWLQWLTAHAEEFQPGHRYRGGRPCTPSVIVNSLVDSHAEVRLRRLAAHELQVRYGCPVRLDVDMPVGIQRRALQRMATWAEANEDRWAPGEWVFAGELQ